MADDNQVCELSSFPPVSEAESGQKLLRFLQRRLDLPESLLHRWLRTGQIRLNGRRAKPFERVHCGDQARLPPCVRQLAINADIPRLPLADDNLPPLIGTHNDIWAFSKPPGLAAQGGSGLADSLADQLRRVYGGNAFVPAPAHRLDRDTGGVLLVGASFEALRRLQTWFAEGKIHKEYLAWTYGRLPFEKQTVVRHYLQGVDRVEACSSPGAGRREARCVMRPVVSTDDATLTQIRLVTGCKRQIRAQLAALGCPVRGDSRYGARPGAQLRLHACRVILPDGAEFTSLPAWPRPWQVEQLPEPMPGAVES